MTLEAVLRPAGADSVSEGTERTFTVRALAKARRELRAPASWLEVVKDAPGVRLHFLHKLDKDSGTAA